MDVQLDAVDLLVKLIVSILVPLIIGKRMEGGMCWTGGPLNSPRKDVQHLFFVVVAGKALREIFKAVRAFVAKYRVELYMFTNFQISAKSPKMMH